MSAEAPISNDQNPYLLPYDGVMGQLPEWVTKETRLAFEAASKYLLKRHSHDFLTQRIADIIECYGESIRESDANYEKYETLISKNDHEKDACREIINPFGQYAVRAHNYYPLQITGVENQ